MNSNSISNIILNTKNHPQTVFLLMVLGVVVRVLGISFVPAGLNQDEASIGYEAFSILTTGLDRNAVSFPIHLISWGSGQNALYAYLSMPFIHFFGLNVFSVRIVNAIFSCLSLLVFYSLIKLAFDRKKALIGLALLVICPWSIMSARWGLESNIFPTIILLGVFFMLKGVFSSQKYFPLSFLFFALSLYAYGTSYLIIPIFLCFSIPYLIYKKKISLKYCLISLSVFTVLAIPILLFLIINHFGLSSIQFINLTISRLISNRTTEIFNLFTPDFFGSLVKNISRLLNIFILQTDGNDYNAIPAFGTIYCISLPFLLIGMYNVLKKKLFLNETHYFIFSVWLVCSILLGIFSHVNINRLNIIFFPLLYYVILGFCYVNEMIKTEYRKNYQLFIIGLYTTLFAFFIGYYIVIFNEKNKDSFSYGLGDAIQYAEKIDATSTINITENTINMPYIYVCFYNQIDPNLFRKTVVYNNENYNGFRNVKHFGRYTFGTNLLVNNAIHVLSRDEMIIRKIDVNRYKKFGNYYIVQNYSQLKIN